MSPAAPLRDDLPAARPPASGLERIVALALAAMAIVLLLVLLDLRRAPALPPAPPFDFQNPMLLSQPGQCVEVSEDATPGSATWLVVRPPGVVLRPFETKGLPGWLNPIWPSPRKFPPYVACDERPAPSGPVAPGSPLPKTELLVFPLNSFGMPLESTVVLRSINQARPTWNGRTRDAYQVNLMGYVEAPGPWTAYLSKDAPALGVMRREFYAGSERAGRFTFRVPETCK